MEDYHRCHSDIFTPEVIRENFKSRERLFSVFATTHDLEKKTARCGLSSGIENDRGKCCVFSFNFYCVADEHLWWDNVFRNIFCLAIIAN